MLTIDLAFVVANQVASARAACVGVSIVDGSGGAQLVAGGLTGVHFFLSFVPTSSSLTQTTAR